MKKFLALAAGMLLFSCSKTETTTQSATPEKQTTHIVKETVVVEKPVVNPHDEFGEGPIPPDEGNQENGTEEPQNNESSSLKNLSGNHNLTLQWISWDKPGNINFKKIGENKYKVSGNQKRGADYLKVEGEITQISNTELAFEGTIETKIASNGGKCLRTGPQTFLVTQNRKYWRMQNMEHCFGLTDYVDIYF